ncbi:hypothetical protein GTS_31410 [Gandjariella thermophila]|uniref:HTH cro/C1-type domain-containing protein n=1 Tax=Gandjariella thermophila TaxID=1931992 RepID=A0A4D4JA11_9PSEU|nr:hypothetical protein GTS_31410 [Gandjariella thermophila]
MRELDRLLSISPTEISHWENGHQTPKLETVAVILAAIRTSPEERERILDLARNESEPNWLTVGMNGIPQQLAGVVEHERAASRLTDCHASEHHDPRDTSWILVGIRVWPGRSYSLSFLAPHPLSVSSPTVPGRSSPQNTT